MRDESVSVYNAVLIDKQGGNTKYAIVFQDLSKSNYELLMLLRDEDLLNCELITNECVSFE